MNKTRHPTPACPEWATSATSGHLGLAVQVSGNRIREARVGFHDRRSQLPPRVGPGEGTPGEQKGRQGPPPAGRCWPPPPARTLGLSHPAKHCGPGQGPEPKRSRSHLPSSGKGPAPAGPGPSNVRALHQVSAGRSQGPRSSLQTDPCCAPLTFLTPHCVLWTLHPQHLQGPSPWPTPCFLNPVSANVYLLLPGPPALLGEAKL